MRGDVPDLDLRVGAEVAKASHLPPDDVVRETLIPQLLVLRVHDLDDQLEGDDVEASEADGAPAENAFPGELGLEVEGKGRGGVAIGLKQRLVELHGTRRVAEAMDAPPDKRPAVCTHARRQRRIDATVGANDRGLT